MPVRKVVPGTLLGVDSPAEHIGLATPGVGKVHSLICEHILQIPVPLVLCKSIFRCLTEAVQHL